MDKKNNSGNRNSGNRNSGNRNSGNRNSGDCNSGDCNSGDYNSGDCNSGDCNSGDCNSGYRNSGHCNSGDCNSGAYNSGAYNSGYFNTDEPTVWLFNKDSGKKRSELLIPYLDVSPTAWVDEYEMSVQEKIDNPNFFVTKGFLKSISYKDAWAIAWEKASKELRQQFLDLPGFDPEIFLEITGVAVCQPTEKDWSDVITINGIEYVRREVANANS